MTVTAIRTASGLPVLHEGAKYGLAGQIVDELSLYTEASDTGVLFSLLAGFGAMLGRTPYIQAGSRQSARIWPLLVGSTGAGRKGTSWATAKMPLWYADRGAFITHNVHSGLSTGEGLIHLVRDGEEPDPDMPRKKLDDGVIDKRRLIVEQEFASRVLAVTRRENSTLSSILREAWEGSTLEVSTRTRPQRATNPHIVLIGHATPTELRTRLSDNDLSGGLVNRFLIVSVRRSKLLPSGDLPPDDLLRALGGELAERLRTARDGPKRLSRTEAASKLWESLYRDILNPDDDDESPFAQSVTRGPAYVARLSLIYAVLDGSSVVDVPHVTAAALAWDYCYSSARQLFGSTAPLDESDDVARAEAYIRSCNGSGVSRSQLSTLFRRAKSSAELDGLTQRLLAGGNVAFGGTPDRSKHPVLVWVGGDQFSQISDPRERSRSP